MAQDSGVETLETATPPESPDPSAAPPADPPAEPQQTVPYTRFAEVIAERNRYKAELDQSRQVSSTSAPAAPSTTAQPQAAAPQFYSRATLAQAVENGTITQEQMDAQLDWQVQYRADQTARQTAQQMLQSQTLRQDLGTYQQFVPNVVVPGTQEHDRYQREHAWLVSQLGAQESEYTRLAAMRSAFGDLDTLRKTRAKPVPPAAHQEVGAGSSQPPTTTKPGDPVAKLNNEQRELYKTMIEKGVYKDWDAVREELTFATKQTLNPRLRR